MSGRYCVAAMPSIRVLYARAAAGFKRAAFYARRGDHKQAAIMARYAGWDSDWARELESWELAVADMASMDAGAGDLSSRSVWS